MRAIFGEFTLDSGTRQLHRGGRELHLSPKAFDLLATLIAQHPAVVDKAALRERLWPGTNVVDANLNNLASEIRTVLGDDAQEPKYLRTAHGVGYAFCAAVREESSARQRQPRAWISWDDQIFAIDDATTTIGRDPGCAIWIDVPGVSRRHASIRREGSSGAFFIEDLGSTNGTFVDGKRLRSAAALADGQAVGVGEATLTFRAPTPADAPTKRIKRR
ncbi:MAG TPA: FHA domain-containing protein [Vicinamibacterales bacterium]|nr:FHA domain-containing protein [Vicinamibacterales bacterium]